MCLALAGTAAPEELLSRPLPADTRRLIEEWYAVEIEVYHFALRLHQSQVAAIQGTVSGPGVGGGGPGLR